MYRNGISTQTSALAAVMRFRGLKKISITSGAVAAGLAIFAVVIFIIDDACQSPPESVDQESSFIAHRLDSSPDDLNDKRHSADDNGAIDGKASGEAPADEMDVDPTGDAEAHRQPGVEPRSGDFESAPPRDAEFDDENRRQTSTPHNENPRPQGLGPADWMAQPEDVDPDAIEKRLLEGEQRQARQLAIQRDRRRSVDAVRPVLHDCHEALRDRRPDAGTRVALGWAFSTSEAVGTIEKPAVLHHPGVTDEAFEDCLVERLDGLSFDATTDGKYLEVEYAFFIP